MNPAAEAEKKTAPSLITPRVLARETRLFNPPPRCRMAEAGNEIIQDPEGPNRWREARGPVVGYSLEQRGPAVYVPKEMAEDLVDLPAEAQAVVAALCTIFLEKAGRSASKGRRNGQGAAHGPVRVSLRKIASTLGMSDAGQNCKKISRVLTSLMHLHVKNLTIARRGAEEITIRVGRIVTWACLKWKQEKRNENALDSHTVEVTLCPELTRLLLSGKHYGQQVRIPVEALAKLRTKPRRARYSTALLFFLLAANPGRGKSFKIGWEKAAKRACIPDVTRSGRPVRPSETKKLVAAIVKDINSTGALSISEEEDGKYAVSYPDGHLPG